MSTMPEKRDETVKPVPRVRESFAQNIVRDLNVADLAHNQCDQENCSHRGPNPKMGRAASKPEGALV